MCLPYSFFFYLNENIILSFLKNMTLNIKVTLVRIDVHFDPLSGKLQTRPKHLRTLEQSFTELQIWKQSLKLLSCITSDLY